MSLKMFWVISKKGCNLEGAFTVLALDGLDFPEELTHSECKDLCNLDIKILIIVFHKHLCIVLFILYFISQFKDAHLVKTWNKFNLCDSSYII